jgi:hypothetical protein
MSDDGSRSKPNRRWRKIAIGVVAIALFCFAIGAWLNHRWIDPRFVGAWRVTNSKSSDESIYILKEDGSARWLQQEGNQWWERGPVEAPFYWSVGRDGFLLQNLSSASSQIGGWFLSLGGLLKQGRLTAPRVVSNAAFGIESVSNEQVRLERTQPGIPPHRLTLDRMDPKDVPPAQR